MRLALAVVVLVGAFSAIASFLVTPRVRPTVAAPVITRLATLSAIAAFWSLLLVAAANVVQLHGIAERLSWCSGLPGKHRGSLSPFGVFALVAVVAIVVSTLRARVRQRRVRAPVGGKDLAIVPSDVPSAYALPGRPGQIVVSTGMLRSLDPDERRVLLAHERAHLRCQHHRYVRLTELAAAAVPALVPLKKRVRRATEMWADQEAVRETGDPALVARAIARAALAQTGEPAPGLGIADSGVLERVEALLDASPEAPRFVEVALRVLVVSGIAGLTLSVVLLTPWVAQLLGFCD